MSWSDKLKEAGVNIHVVATGGGAGLQQFLWEIPGSSAYLSGGSFPYDQAEQEEFLGFMPKQFCSEEAAIDLASAAYMKAYKFGGKKPVGLAITASVASEKEHRGEHRVFACVMTDTEVRTCRYSLEKGAGSSRRLLDGATCDDVGLFVLLDTLGLTEGKFVGPTYNNATAKARERFFERPFFTANGKRYDKLPEGSVYAMMPGSFNPPHEGHFGLARSFRHTHSKNVLFEIGTNPPHKDPPTVQELLQRAKMLKGYDVLFTKDIPKFIEKARAYPGMPLIMGADTLLRILDPKWGTQPQDLIRELRKLRTKLFVAERLVDGKPVDCDDIVDDLDDILSDEEMDMAYWVIQDLEGRWDISSTELRNKIK